VFEDGGNGVIENFITSGTTRWTRENASAAAVLERAPPRDDFLISENAGGFHSDGGGNAVAPQNISGLADRLGFAGDMLRGRH